ncbi:CbbQ/NirQ/NorQ/GpvN family protein [Candidatus Contubernalis alkaliaceticus]|uniref:CbbQ/NirQ/NorQ/GpvN family protein n=1 Tax=Candidatus Contubernalis alkaliaceticus TaxID=338645 RepID=UPI001F4C1031|nr:CbbQ/NirQ/NorQ/GpvN family protein [Candidatus Contubernalis alkalaceticus]UNC91571.1 CbbQ/NirQ/NorQ/GpvN family protein [Candidatus Contubernalis alkalaceticus]
MKTLKLEEFYLKEEPFYIPQENELQLFELAYHQQIPVMLKGPTGCGKTRFLEHMAFRLNRPLITIACHEDLTTGDLVGRFLLKGEDTVWVDGPLTRAVRHGAICYLDEVVEARKDTVVAIHPLTDDRRILPLEKMGEVIKADENFMLVCSYNPGYQTILKDLKQSTKQRFISMEFGFPEADIEKKILIKESGVKEQIAEKIIQIGSQFRNLKNKGLEEGVSTRLMIYAGKLIGSGVSLKEAVRTAMIYPITDDAYMHKGLGELVDAAVEE